MPGFEVDLGRELRLVDRQLELRVQFAIAFGRRDGNFFLIADFQTFERIFETGDDLLPAVEVCERSVAVRPVQDFTLIVFQGVDEVDDFSVRNGLICHGSCISTVLWKSLRKAG